MGQIDSKDLEAFYLKDNGNLVKFLTKITEDYHAAQDIAHDTFVRAHRYRNNFDRDEASLKTWIYEIGQRLAFNYVRTRDNRRNLLSMNLVSVPCAKHYSQIDEERDKRVAGRIQKAIDALPPKYKTAAILRYQEELSEEEMVKIMHVPIGTVKSRVSRATERLREDLRDIT